MGEPLCLDKLGLAPPQGFLGPLALCHIDIDADHPWVTITVIGNKRAGLDPPHAGPREVDAVVDIVFALLLTEDLLAQYVSRLQTDLGATINMDAVRRAVSGGSDLN